MAAMPFLCNGGCNIKRIIKDNKVVIFRIQETELPINVPETLPTIPNYNIETENNNLKSKAAIYINDNIQN